MIMWIYGVILLVTGVYSYFLIDPNITFFQNSYWVLFRDWAVYLGYYRRDISWIVYLTLLILLFIFHFILLKKFKQYSVLRIAGLITLIGCISYPFLSHDLFNYLFDARILTHYGLNPYTHMALDFQKDLWTRFMHWTHRTYPYGPTFLPLTLIPSFLGWGKFSITFFLYKLMNGVLYFLAVYFLNKKNKREALFFATHPLIVIEGLINGHNDMIAVSLGLIGIYLFEKKYDVRSRIFFLISAGIKYITVPLLLFFVGTRVLKKVNLRYRHLVLLAFILQVFLIVYLCYKMEIQPWYFLSLFVYIPYFLQFIEKLNILFFGLLISYYPFIRFGDWTAKTVALKREIVFVAVFAQVGFVLLLYLRKRKFLIR
ncbi:MAG: hypothetical protein V1922_04315 [bacterium]